MAVVAIRRKFWFIIFLSGLVFLIFQIFLTFSPKLFKFSTNSAISSAKLNLASYDDWQNGFEIQKLFSHFIINNNETSNSDNVVNKEERNFKSNEDMISEFEPPFLIGPAKINFSPDELNKFDENDGPILRNCYGGSSSSIMVKLSETAFAKNLTKLPNDVIIKANQTQPSFNLDKTDKPQVLILHTHATEAFELKEKNYYSNKAPSHSLNSKITVIGISDQIVNGLQESKIVAIHDKTIHDDPSYNGAYDRSNKTIRNHLEKNPSIKVVLDIHRDGIQNDNNERIAPVTKIEGRKAAQIMIIAGCDNGTMRYPNYEQNLAFACFLQRQLELDYPKITRPLLFKYKHYNQSLTPGTLLIEIGSNSNSVDEANYSSWLFGKSLARALSKLQK